MNDIERKKYATHIEKLSDIDLIREISQYPKTWSDERKIIEEEQERRRALLQQSPEYLKGLIEVYDNVIKKYKEIGVDYRPPYIYTLMKYRLRNAQETEEMRRGK